MCHGLECFSFPACHRGGWPVFILRWFSERTDKLLHLWMKTVVAPISISIHVVLLKLLVFVEEM